ncbi:MAG TPA: cobalamin-binding protein [Burkholderiales bacterium]|nr:cobalamin-binding protein [Burkholderiales bacterium]
MSLAAVARAATRRGMRQWRRVAFAAFTTLALQNCIAAAAVSLADDRGKTVVLAAPAQRIVTLAPHLAEIVFAAGAGERLVGVARFSDYPQAAQRLPQVGDGSRVDLERIVVLRPDLILAWKSGNQAGDIARLEKLGYPVLVTEPSRLEDIPRLLRAVGTLAGTALAAQREIDKFNNKINMLRNYYGSRPRLRVFYEIWSRPLLTVNRRHMISDVMTLCGGRNVFAEAPVLTPVVSVEAVLAAQPEAILGGGSAAEAGRFAAQWRESPVEALRKVPVFYVEPDIIQRQTPRIVEGAEAICKDLESVRRNRQGRREKPLETAGERR